MFSSMRKLLRPHGQESPIYTTNVSALSLQDWWVLTLSLILVVSTVLSVINGICSKPQALTAQQEVCVGGWLSIQSWLAIVGIELSLLTTIILPRVQNIFISKHITRRLTDDGVPLSKLLNAQSSAPVFAQIRSGVQIFLLRILVLAFIAAISILYKYSFVRVAAQGAISLLVDEGILSTNSRNIYSPISDNLDDVLSQTTASSLVIPSNSSTGQIEIIFGYSFNSTVGNVVSNGTMFSCRADAYSKTTVQISDPSWSNTAPIIPTTPSNTSIRFVNPADNSLVDITSSDGNLEALFGYPGNDTLGNIHYSTKMTAGINLCLGLTSWTTTQPGPFASYDSRWQLDPPEEVGCLDEPFDLASWQLSTPGMFTINLFQGLLALQTPNRAWRVAAEPVELSNITIPLIVAGMDPLNDPSVANFTLLWAARGTSTWPACQDYYGVVNIGGGAMIAKGLIFNNGTGMTLIGLVLQVVVLVVTLLAIGLQFWPTLPLVREWPAQWLALLQDMDRDYMRRALSGVSVGQNAVRGEEVVFLHSAETEDGETRLMLSMTKGEIMKGKAHR